MISRRGEIIVRSMDELNEIGETVYRWCLKGFLALGVFIGLLLLFAMIASF